MGPTNYLKVFSEKLPRSHLTERDRRIPNNFMQFLCKMARWFQNEIQAFFPHVNVRHINSKAMKFFVNLLYIIFDLGIFNFNFFFY